MSERILEDWVDSVASGAATMSQRNVRWVEANGGIDRLISVAKQRGVHLLRLTDDKGNEIVAASQNPFHTLC